MDTNCLVYGIEIPTSDWDNTPASVRELVEKLGQRIKKSEEKLANSVISQSRTFRENKQVIKKLIISAIK